MEVWGIGACSTGRRAARRASAWSSPRHPNAEVAERQTRCVQGAVSLADVGVQISPSAPKASFHASEVLQAGQNVVVLSKRLGHANISITTDIYAHALPGWQLETADAFARAMEG